MLTTKRTEDEEKQKLNKELEEKNKSIDYVKICRDKIIGRGNANGINQLGRKFRIMDDNRSYALDEGEFIKGMKDFGVTMPTTEIKKVFEAFNKDGSGTINFDEFLHGLRPPLSKHRLDIIQKAFDSLDKSGDGIIDASDIRKMYNVTRHPKYLNGELTKDECLNLFLNNFEVGGVKDGRVNKEEFLNYYSGISHSIENDAYFDLVMLQSWGVTP